MCGIAGIWQLDGQPLEVATVERFIGALAHRGPDGQGVLLADAGRLALAHRRLAILDLSAAGDQPMRSASGRYDITYNGEIYNFLELREELERDGYRFRSESDTEVILAAFERWGPDCLLRFNGMWSFAIWDRRDRALFLARDRFGVKPLYVMANPRRFAFASEVKAFLHLDGFEAVADRQVLEARLADNFDERVLLRGVECVLPGHCLTVTPNGARRRRWWSTLEHLVRVPQDVATQAEEFRELLFDACRLRARSDVPMATSLSGGLDSSSVLCALARSQQRGGGDRQAPEWRRAFIAGFPGTPQDETRYATLAADRAGATPVVHQFSGDEFAEHIDAYLYQFEEIGGLFGVAAWALYREMRREGIIVSLEGHGGDELLGGYDLHVLLALMGGRGLVAAPGRTLDLIDTLYHLQPEISPKRAVLAALTIPGVRAIARHLPVARRRERLLAQTVRRHSFDPATVIDEAARVEEQAIDALGPLTGALYRSFHRHSLPRILRNFDVHSMGHGIEVRTPLLDWRLVCYAFSVPDESKVAGGYTKRLLREAMRGVLPEPVQLRRAKLGYNAPVAQWLHDGLGEWLWDEVNDPEFLRSELWDGRALLGLTRAKRDSRAPWHRDEAHRATLAVTAHWWQTRWLRGAGSPSVRTLR
ncbi:MAG TPA: asparagine synthase (glutamine-hydrolyzing) [Candidatus Bathyarchaeia archaeon]|nr:asparagine synthase (glutamine-hydrolyzing) [Candidatus Bathyarchaeia archaeon]